MTIVGKGFPESVAVTVCDEPCELEDWSVTQLVCLTPPGAGEFVVDAMPTSSFQPIRLLDTGC